MPSLVRLLAAIELSNPLQPAPAAPSKPFGEALTEMWPILAAVCGLALLLLLWARFLRRSRRHGAADADVAAEGGWGKSRRRVRRSGHPERPRNPTLAETGGLPPLRPESPPTPTPPPSSP